jgi:peptide/nickel transport system substrate-binding protein
MSSPNVTVGYLVPEFEVWNMQYAPLVDKAAEDFSPQPGLAESWEVSDDGLTVTYTLREGLLWSDGTPLTAEDVAYTINRSRDEEWYNHFATTQNLDAVVIDERTVEVTSSVPDPKLPTIDVYIVPKHVFEQYDVDALAEYDGLDGVASGPYSLTEWRSGQDWTLVKNPNWYGRDNGIDQVIFRVFTNPDAMVAALQQGEIDFAHNVPVSSFELLEGEDDIVTVAGMQGGFTELALNGGQGGIGDGHPALQDINVRQAIYHAIDRDVLFERVALGIGAKGTTMSPSADPTWVPDLGDELYTYDPDRSNQLLDDAGYLDTDGDGVREMPDGSRPLEFRYVERSESENSAAIREFITEWLRDVGIATTVDVMDDTQLYDAQVAGNYDMFAWGWTPFVDPDPMLSYFTCDEVTTDPEDAGYNDANWCSEEYDALYQQQKVELDPARRREIVAEMLRLFNRESTYLVLLQDADTQAYRTDRFEGWLQQPAGTGPVLFTNSSPTYANLSVIGAEAPAESATTAEASDGTGESTGEAVIAPAPDTEATTGGATSTDEATAADDDDDGGSNTGLIIGIIVAAAAVIGIGAYAMKRRSSADDRE